MRPDRREACWRLLELELDESEQVLAEGRAHYSASGYGEQSTYDYLVVTDIRLGWADFLAPKRAWVLPFDLVTSYLEKQQPTHRYFLHLHHAPVTRIERTTAHRFLWWRWGNALHAVKKAETIFMFSRRDTKAAVAIRRQLEARGIPGETQGPTEREIELHDRSIRMGRAMMGRG